MESPTISKRNTPRKPRPNDTVQQKRFPTSLSATLRGIRLYSDSNNANKFSAKLKSAFDRVMRLYPGSGKNPKSLERIIERAERGSGDLRYYVMRTYAEHLAIPTGLLLLFSHVTGDVADGKPIESTRDTLAGSIRALSALLDDLNKTDYRSRFLPSASDQELQDGRYNISLDVLKRYLLAYEGKSA